jgi:hypothetical protein
MKHWQISWKAGFFGRRAARNHIFAGNTATAVREIVDRTDCQIKAAKKWVDRQKEEPNLWDALFIPRNQIPRKGEESLEDEAKEQFDKAQESFEEVEDEGVDAEFEEEAPMEDELLESLDDEIPFDDLDGDDERAA